MMVRIDISGFYHTFDNDLEIVEALVTEQSVFCLPGKCFNIPNFFRIGKKESQKMKSFGHTIVTPPPPKFYICSQ